MLKNFEEGGCAMVKLSLGREVTLDGSVGYISNNGRETLYRTKYGEWVLMKKGAMYVLVTHRHAVKFLYENGYHDDAEEYEFDRVYKDKALDI